MDDEAQSLLEMTAEIVAAYVGSNTVAANQIPGLISSIHSALANINEPPPAPEPETTKKTTAQIRKSITPDALISFEDGKPYKTLKRHLAGRGLTIAEYKSKWGLPNDYPSTAPNYSAQRSALAKQLGLGQGGRGSSEAPAAPARPRGRPKKG